MESKGRGADEDAVIGGLIYGRGGRSVAKLPLVDGAILVSLFYPNSVHFIVLPGRWR